MNSGVFLLLFIIFFVLIAVVVWVVRDSREVMPMENENEEEQQDQLLDDSDEARQWLEDLARRQQESGTRRLH